MKRDRLRVAEHPQFGGSGGGATVAHFAKALVEQHLLQWGDFNLEKSTLLVQRGIVHGRVGET
jgi:hypothetical protein